MFEEDISENAVSYKREVKWLLLYENHTAGLTPVEFVARCIATWFLNVLSLWPKSTFQTWPAVSVSS